MKRNWFFLTEKLQITPAERTAVTTLIAVLVVLWSIPASWFRPEPFDQEYYAPVLAEFQEKVQLREIEREQTLARFYPPADFPSSHTVPGTNEAGQTLTLPAGLQNPDPSGTAGDTVSAYGGAGKTDSGTSRSAEALRSSGSPASSGSVHADTVEAGGRSAPEPGTGARIKININTADVAELQKLPGIGPSIAARIVEYRVQNGPFRTVEEITGVRGIGEVRLNNLRNSITVD